MKPQERNELLREHLEPRVLRGAEALTSVLSEIETAANGQWLEMDINAGNRSTTAKFKVDRKNMARHFEFNMETSTLGNIAGLLVVQDEFMQNPDSLGTISLHKVSDEEVSEHSRLLHVPIRHLVEADFNELLDPISEDFLEHMSLFTPKFEALGFVAVAEEILVNWHRTPDRIQPI